MADAPWEVMDRAPPLLARLDAIRMQIGRALARGEGEARGLKKALVALERECAELEVTALLEVPTVMERFTSDDGMWIKVVGGPNRGH